MQQPNPASNTNLLALPEGTELVGDYRIQRVLGAGGFGITYLANEPALARLVTIKEYFPADYAARGATSQAAPRSQGCAEDYKWGLERFIEEARTLAKFIHPNIVRVHRHFLANNTGYMVLEFEEGGSFKSWLKGLKRAPRQPELDRILAPLLEALELVHRGDFLHRDIAPDNIIIRKDGSPVLIDFGSARGDIASHSKTVSALVKPGYSPYEQYATTSSKQGPWTDIYALGATLYHALSGKRPPDAPSRMVNDEYVPARDAALSSYRPGFLAAIDKALELEIGERPQSISEWRGTLLAPEPKREARVSLVRALQRLRTADFKPRTKSEPDPEPPPSAEPPSDTRSLVPTPPDAPAPKGQLLDFIEALKKRRPAFAAKAAKKTPRAAAARATTPPASSVAPARQPASAQFGLGYGPPRDVGSSSAPAAASQAVAAMPQSVERPPPAVLARRAPPRPRRVRSWRVPSRRWRSLLYKLMIGLGIAGLAVAYQDRLPQVEGRGANVVSSQVADLAPVSRILAHRGTVTAIAVDDQARWIVSAGADGTLKVWNAGSGALVRTIELDEGAATVLALDQQRALTGHKGGAVVLWDLEKAEKLAVFQHQEAPISALAFTGDPNQFVAASQAGAVALYDLRARSTPLAMLEGQDGLPQTIASARAGLLASAGLDRSIKLYRADMGGLARTWRGQGDMPSALGIAPGGRTVASGSAGGTVRLWSASSSRLQRSFRAHDGRVTALAFAAASDRQFASAGEDGQVKLWDLRGRAPARVFRGHIGPVQALAFSTDGRRLLSAGQDGVIRIWSNLAAPRE
jgi:serine/threonine protein kinase/WD40 repeat protein